MLWQMRRLRHPRLQHPETPSIGVSFRRRRPDMLDRIIHLIRRLRYKPERRYMRGGSTG